MMKNLNGILLILLAIQLVLCIDEKIKSNKTSILGNCAHDFLKF